MSFMGNMAGQKALAAHGKGDYKKALPLYEEAFQKGMDKPRLLRGYSVLLIRNLSAISLGVTLVTLILNFVLAVSAEALGSFLHYVLVVVSTPMICSGYWVLSLFLWACLLMASLKKSRKQKKSV